jgi:5-formyltetrahydrofolate cyclo-ligase
MRQVLAAMPSRIAARGSEAACRRLIELPEFRAARVVMIYLAMPEEVDTAAIALAAWRDEKAVLAPRVSWEQRHMLPIEIHSLSSGLLRARYGAPEPESGEPWPLEDIDLVVTPALAFDRRGGRLGRGAGFYDRFFAETLVRATRCGLAFAEQVLPELPVHAHDCPIDILVTDAEVLRFQHDAQAL